MALVTSYQTLKDHISDTLNRQDLTGSVPVFIQMAEASLKREPRVRKLQERSPFTVSADNTDLPSDFKQLETLAHDGTTYYGDIEITSPSGLTAYKGAFGTSGPPRYAAIIGTKMRFAPVPAEAYNLKMTYWLRLDSLSDTNTSNWLLQDHPDIYIYSALLESAPYLKDDARIPVWAQAREQRIEELYLDTVNQAFSGKLSRRPTRAIGG